MPKSIFKAKKCLPDYVYIKCNSKLLYYFYQYHKYFPITESKKLNILWSEVLNLSIPNRLSWLLKVPYDFGDLGAQAKGGHVVNTNHRRVVETWMDSEHKEYFYTRVPLARFSKALYARQQAPHFTSSRYLDPGDLSAQMALRNTCQPWSWYMAKVTFNP